MAKLAFAQNVVLRSGLVTECTQERINNLRADVRLGQLG